MKMLNLLNEESNSKFVTRKWNIVNNQSDANYDVGNEIIYNTEILKCNLCGYNNAYILLWGYINIVEGPTTQVVLKKLCTIL